ncbi:MAG: site-specific integrase, partial [Pseudonocardiaceae bacterium]
LVMVTGLRRAELLALRWLDVDLAAGKLTIRRNYVRVAGKMVVKDTKTHQMRRISLDPTTVEVLTEHRQRHEELALQLRIEPSDEAYLFSRRPSRDVPYDPDAVTHRYAKMCAKLGIDSHLHALRHYSATELVAAGVDVTAAAARLWAVNSSWAWWPPLRSSARMRGHQPPRLVQGASPRDPEDRGAGGDQRQRRLDR